MEKSKEVTEKKLRTILWHNFLGGVSWGLGITVGATIILAIGTFVVARIDYIPLVGSFVVNIIEFVAENNPDL